jgi:amidase
MRRLTKDKFVTAFSAENPAAYTIADGETVVVETRDCFGDFVTREGEILPGSPGPNPATGPIAVKGSVPGEALAVTIHEVKPADWGFIGTWSLGRDQKPLIITMADGCATYPWGLRLPLDPMIGVIGVAPEGEAIPTTTPHDWGGNLDTTDVKPGATVYFPVAVPGAMLALGDVHALQADAESCGTGIECSAEVTLTARRVPEALWHCPLIVRNDQLILVASAETVDAAARRAVDEMAGLLGKLAGLSDKEARALISTAGDIRISQIVNPKKTCRAVMPRAAIPEAWPF